MVSKILSRWELARPEGLEPPTYWFEASRSIQLSYGRAVLSLPRRAAKSTQSFVAPCSAAMSAEHRQRDPNVT